MAGTALAAQPHADVDGLKTTAAPFEASVEIQSTTPNRTQEAATPAPATVPNSTEKSIAINLASRMLTVYEGNTKIAMYPVGVGKVSTPSPTGTYSIQNKEENPTWIDPENTECRIESGENNPLGYRWMGFNGTYGIHGTNHPESVGYYVSNGCIRMHEEDVEQVYPMVSVGTPVKVYYDRIVIDRAPDHTISYYIYPDGYGWQSLSVQAVKKSLAGYGVEDFASPASITAKIAASDGKPTYVAKAYDLYVNGKKLAKRALGKDEIICLPAVAVATALQLDLHWNAQNGVLTSPYGTVSGIVKSDVVYMDAADAYTLFHLRGMLTPDYSYEMRSVSPSQTATVTISSTI
jgi:lipoprotein-anchoring transpeptidase ErfK/SrfK